MAGLEIAAALLRQAGGPLAIETVRLDVLRPDEVRVRLVATGICHTDLTIMHRAPNLPMLLGHEGAGVVEAVGSAVRRLAIGDPVVMSYSACGGCPACGDGEPYWCDHFFPLNFGGRRADGSATVRDQAGEPVSACFFGQSSFATHAIARERDVVKVRADAPLEMLGPLGCGFLTGAGTVLSVMQPGPGSTLAVFGTGAVGCAAIMAARHLGCGRIIAVDRLASRLALARDLGATEVIDTSAVDLAPALAALGGIDFAVETTGAAAVINAAAAAVKRRGICALHAVAGEAKVELDVRGVLGGQTLMGVCEGCSDPQTLIPRLVDLYMAGEFPLEKLVRFYPFAEIAAAMADAEAGRVIKPILRF